MLTPIFRSALTFCVAPALLIVVGIAAGSAPMWAQPDPQIKPLSDLPYRTVSLAEAQKLLGGATLALHLRDVTFEQALQELQKQSDVALTIPQLQKQSDVALTIPPKAGEVALQKRLSIDLDTPSLSQAFRALVASAGVKAALLEAQSQNGNVLMVVFNPKPREADRAPQSGVGRFQIRVNQLSSSVTQRVTAGADHTFKRDQNGGLDIGFGLAPDPGLAEVELPRLQLTRADDDAGRSLLLPPNPFFPPAWGNGTGYGQRCNFGLRLAPADAQKLAHLEGTAICTFPTRREQWDVPDLLQNAGWTREFRSNDRSYFFKMVSAKREGDKVNVKLDVSPGFDGQKLLRNMILQDAAGHTFPAGSSTTNGGGDAATAEVQFDVGRNPAQAVVLPLRLSFDVPVDWVQTAVPFSFENVPLPQVEEEPK